MVAVSGAVFCSADSMLSVTPAPAQRPESPTLVVVTTVLQLGLVVVVWLLALIPAAIAALAVLTFKLIRAAFRKTAAAHPKVEADR
jgi:hypothetical protein